MSDGTKIEWTDATWNPITGCAIVSPGCTNCYAMKLAGTRLQHHLSRAGLTKNTKAGPVWTGEVRFNEQWLDEPLRWKRPRMIFVCAHGDLFAEGVPDEWIDKVFAVMALAPQHIFQVLTKRPERMREYLTGGRRGGHLLVAAQLQFKFPIPSPAPWPHMPLPNVWLGVSVEDQKRADERIPILLDTPAAIRWISAEPLLGPLDLDKDGAVNTDSGRSYLRSWGRNDFYSRGLDWIVAGGESGVGARPMHPHWVYALRDQCAIADVPFLFKQWGNWIVASAENGHTDSSMATNDAIWLDIDGRQAKPSCDGMREPIGMFRVTKARAGRTLEGRLHDGFPILPAHFAKEAAE
ncbi:phage Gp37/Gp68 family protein [Rhizobium leguminosarum bv. viciae]|uniref:phage Gp37/Gp68 family protein n=1 Tax=Rhizobium TaxID=379 RepID=UPI00103A37DE|nr:phage Gp37/Gp68 family protein [Rhizobium leguminosarum]TBZ67865.1 phage Gp37/Gp68 family protein [Rhizobium leguminosarum bv. viciae]